MFVLPNSIAGFLSPKLGFSLSGFGLASFGLSTGFSYKQHDLGEEVKSTKEELEEAKEFAHLLRGYSSPASEEDAGWPTFPEVQYVVGKRLGSGSSADVFQAKKVDDTSYFGSEETAENCALKLFDPDQAMSKTALRNEIKVLQFLSRPENEHPNIIKISEVITREPGYIFEDCKRVERSCLRRTNSSGPPRFNPPEVAGIAMDLVEGLELFDLLPSTTSTPLSLGLIKYIFKQLCRALVHLHGLNLVHLDLKPENVMVRENGTVVLTDFGFAQFVKPRFEEYAKVTLGLSRKGHKLGSFLSSSSTSTGMEEVNTRSIRPGIRPTLADVKIGPSWRPQRMRTSTCTSFTAPGAGQFRGMGYPTLLHRGSRFPKSMSTSHLNAMGDASPKRKRLNVKTVGGTMKYKAPETYAELNEEFHVNIRDSSGRVTSPSFEEMKTESGMEFDGAAADVWSLGCILYALYFGKLPTTIYGHEVDVSVDLESGWATPKGSVSSPSVEALETTVYDLITGMLEADPKKRLGMDEVCAHPWVQAEESFHTSSKIEEELKTIIQKTKEAKTNLEIVSPLVEDSLGIDFLSNI
eukprot:snap_masked-scaffold_4-processed-gene-20.27-mRNA-1 protein AED:0.44 eAED:0.44 QI:0/-1/0/1/-1/1/1/0/579